MAHLILVLRNPEDGSLRYKGRNLGMHKDSEGDEGRRPVREGRAPLA
jgi:hypothetical protein